MLPSRPVLLPGLPVLRRDERHLQIGLDPPRCAVVRDDPDVRRVLAQLHAGQPPLPRTEAGAQALDQLARAGLLADLDELERRRASRLEVTVGLDAPADLTRPVTDRLRAADLVVAADLDQAGVLLVLSDGQVPRQHLDPYARDGTPHLLVSTEPVGMIVGPFVEPGRTACVRCVDAHLGLADPRRALLLEQATVRVPREPVLHAVALAWAVADLVAWAEGRVPSTWSATVRFDASLDVRRTPWARHPGCGCAWDQALTG
ncbi:TOMM precursor leader peptide-binding protein [Nocardioides sp. W7]|uniref:TOMM precursor leader peptide-binding protein n=1 Tax=Nocardioides sp. W7 TaxID=2931390 RepID=UPI001FCFC70A|nr:TOMM precursor leader peptide-binding protein [Nocardioides sp. W7]